MNDTPQQAPRPLRNLLVTGGAGFIGTNFIRCLFGLGTTGAALPFSGRVVNADLLTYAGNADNLAEVKDRFPDRYVFEKADIGDHAAMAAIFSRYGIDAVVHFAAESHVDRSISEPAAFIRTNVLGTHALLEVARSVWGERQDVLFHHVSTDEVYGSLGPTGAFRETTPYAPRSPYSASKAASDHLVQAWFHTYGLPVTISNCSNNYGPYQFPEKFIPLMILNLVEGRPLPLYGDGRNVRDWLHVEDHASAIWTVMNRGAAGEAYNVGGDNECENIRLLEQIIGSFARLTGRDSGALRALITPVADRPGHDRRYAIDAEKLRNQLGWRARVDFGRGLDATIQWYLDNPAWIEATRRKLAAR